MDQRTNKKQRGISFGKTVTKMNDVRDVTYHSIPSSEPSNDAQCPHREVVTVTREGNENDGNALSDTHKHGVDAPGPTSEPHRAVHGRKIQIQKVVTTHKRKADDQNEQENRKLLRMEHTVHNENEPQSSPNLASELPRTVITRGDNSPHSRLWRRVMTVANGHESASARSTAEIVRLHRGSRIERNHFFDDHKRIDPIERIDISQVIPAERDEISVEAHRTMVAKSYQKWNPWGMKAVCGTGILQDIMWDEVKQPLSLPNDGATCGEKIGFTIIMQ